MNQMWRIVVEQWIMGFAATTCTLIKQHRSAKLRVKQLPVTWAAAATWPAVQKDDGNALGVTALFEIHTMAVFEWQEAMMERLNRCKQALKVFDRHALNIGASHE